MMGDKKHLTQDQVKRAYVPMFPGLSVVDFLSFFARRVPIGDFLPDDKPIHKVPRGFILDVIRTLATKEFDDFVKANIASRQLRIIEKTNKAVTMLPIFAENLKTTNLYSTKNGKAHMLLKRNAKPRKKKAQLLQAHREKEEEKQHIAYLMQAEATLALKNFRMEDAVAAIDQNEKMTEYLKERGIMDDKGSMKV